MKIVALLETKILISIIKWRTLINRFRTNLAFIPLTVILPSPVYPLSPNIKQSKKIELSG